jgi:hypothetical protein
MLASPARCDLRILGTQSYTAILLVHQFWAEEPGGSVRSLLTHAALTSDGTMPAWNGCLPTMPWRCGVTFERWARGERSGIPRPAGTCRATARAAGPPICQFCLGVGHVRDENGIHMVRCDYCEGKGRAPA